MIPRILYRIGSFRHRHMFRAFAEREGYVQAGICLKSFYDKKLNINTVFRMTMESPRHFDTILEEFKPNMLVQCDMFDKFASNISERNIKRTFVMQGIWLPSPSNFKRVHDSFWKQFDLICGGRKQFVNFFKDIPEYSDKMILTNALPQFDLLYYEFLHRSFTYKQLLKNVARPDVKKIITFFGHRCVDSPIREIYNENYFRTAVKLAEIATKYNWLILIKPKTINTFKFISSKAKIKDKKYDWARELKKKYHAIRDNKLVRIFSAYDEPYKYFCADAVVLCARSTVEIEAALVNMPLIKVYSEQSDWDIYETHKFGALNPVYDINCDLEDVLLNTVQNKNMLVQAQQKFVDYMGITFDGKAHERVQNAIREMVNR